MIEIEEITETYWRQNFREFNDKNKRTLGTPRPP